MTNTLDKIMESSENIISKQVEVEEASPEVDLRREYDAVVSYFTLSGILGTTIDQMDPEIKELIADCLASSSNSVEVSIYDPRVYELVKHRVVKVTEQQETEGTLRPPRYKIQLEDWFLDLLKRMSPDISRIGDR